MRYQVFNSESEKKPAFDTPWYLLAKMYIACLADRWPRCYLLDTKKNEILIDRVRDADQ